MVGSFSDHHEFTLTWWVGGGVRSASVSVDCGRFGATEAYRIAREIAARRNAFECVEQHYGGTDSSPNIDVIPFPGPRPPKGRQWNTVAG